MNVLDADTLPGRLAAAGFERVRVEVERKRLEFSAVKPS